MHTNTKARIVILGGGPTGLEAALYARELGYPVTVLEKGDAAAANIRRWGFVQMFTPWSMNTSPAGLAALERRGLPLPPPAVCPRGDELVERYLQPLADSLGESFRPSIEVVGVARSGLIKRESIGGERRAGAPFRLLARGKAAGEGSVEEELTADIVIDATGVYDTPAALGDGGVPALGEESARGVVRYHLVDAAGAERRDFTGKTTLLVGSGFSAATSLLALLDVVAADPRGELIWARRSTDPAPFPTYANDPLPLRAELARRGNAVAAKPPAGLRVLAGVTVQSIQLEGDTARVALRPVGARGGAPETVSTHHIVAHVGYRPNVDLFRELHVHQCYASEGPMKLAAALLGESAAGGDCLDRTSAGIETLLNPEPRFFILGGKSYGRRDDFLLRTGREQIRDLFRYLEDDPELDLYRDSR